MKAVQKRLGWQGLRLASQAFFGVLFLMPLLGLPWFTGTYVSSQLLGIRLTDPFGAVQVLVAGGVLAGGTLWVLLIYLLVGRAFCAWVCPLGTALEWLDRLSAGRWTAHRALRWHLPRWSRWLLALVLLGLTAVTGVTLFEWLSPQATLMRSLLFGAGAEVLVLGFIVAFDLFILRRGWCRTLCPSGAFYSLLGRFALLRVHHDRDACSHCGKCIQACPMDGKVTLWATVSGHGPARADPWNCSNCGRCIDLCAPGALNFKTLWSARRLRAERGTEVAASTPIWGPPLSRRAAIGLMSGAVAIAGLSATRPILAAPRERHLLRPPGALPEAAFLGLCLRCGQCLQACPREALHLGRWQHGLSLGTPYLIPRQVGCDLCGACVPACPTGALWLDPGEPIRMGTAVIDTERCLAYHGDICRSCFVACPLQGQAIFLKEALRPAIDPNHCTGCGLCEEHCIVEPAAIIIQPAD